MNRALRNSLLMLCCVLILAPPAAYFGIDAWFAFGAVFGFVSCVAMVVAAKALGALIKRDERYYDD